VQGIAGRIGVDPDIAGEGPSPDLDSELAVTILGNRHTYLIFEVGTFGRPGQAWIREACSAVECKAAPLVVPPAAAAALGEQTPTAAHRRRRTTASA